MEIVKHYLRLINHYIQKHLETALTILFVSACVGAIVYLIYIFLEFIDIIGLLMIIF